jgi:copper transport protein
VNGSESVPASIRREWKWLFCLFLMVGLTQVASAHPVVKRAVPAAGDTLRGSPRELTLVFSTAIQLSLSSVELVGADGRTHPIGPLVRSGTDGLTAAIAGTLATGSYHVRWRTAGEDGHPVGGQYTFVVAPQVGAPGDTARPSVVEHHSSEVFPQQVEQFGVGSAGFVAIRGITYALLITLIGVAGFQVLVLQPAGRRLGPDGVAFAEVAMTQSNAIGVAASSGLVLAGFARLAAQVYALTDTGSGPAWETVFAVVSGGAWGSGMALQIGGGLLAIGGFVHARRHAAGASKAAYLAVCALVFFPALSGHAVAVDRFGVLPIVSDAVHVLSAGGWLGTLLVIMLVGVPNAFRRDGLHPGRVTSALVNAFSPAALVFAGLAVVTGGFAAWMHLGNFAALWSSDYGRTLLLKLAVVSLVALTGGYNWRRVRPALGTNQGTRRLTLSASIELVVAAVVIGITAVLVATPPPSGP